MVGGEVGGGGGGGRGGGGGGGGGGELPCMGYGYVRCEGYGFQAVYSKIASRIGYYFLGN